MKCTQSFCTATTSTFLLTFGIHVYVVHQAACWSPDGKILVFAVANEPALYSLQFQDVGKCFKEKPDLSVLRATTLTE